MTSSCSQLFLKHGVSFLQAAAGPPKKGKATNAAGGKNKKAAENRDITETELSVSHTFIFHMELVHAV